jgi:hypothetical protein
MKEKQTAPEETEITAEEVDKQIRKLKKRKARGGMYGTERMVERMAELMNGVYRGQERRKTEPGITLVVCVCFERKDEERDRGKGSVAG